MVPLNGTIHIGKNNLVEAGAEKSCNWLTEILLSLGFEGGRMKTGTPPRVDGRSLDYSKMEEQEGDANPGKFSYMNTPKLESQRSCHITYTNPNVHNVLKTGFEQSPRLPEEFRFGAKYIAPL